MCMLMFCIFDLYEKLRYLQLSERTNFDTAIKCIDMLLFSC